MKCQSKSQEKLENMNRQMSKDEKHPIGTKQNKIIHQINQQKSKNTTHKKVDGAKHQISYNN